MKLKKQRILFVAVLVLALMMIAVPAAVSMPGAAAPGTHPALPGNNSAPAPAPAPNPAPAPSPAVSQGIKIVINNAAKTFDVPPVMRNNRVLVPLRGIFEALGVDVTWDETTQTVTAVSYDKVIKLTIGSKTATKNDQAVQLDQPAVIVNGRTMVPVRFVSESLGATVKWVGEKKTVVISYAPQAGE